MSNRETNGFTNGAVCFDVQNFMRPALIESLFDFLCSMRVFKFGGASVANAERIRQVVQLLESFSGEELLIVVSAMGKTTNALENVAGAFFSGNNEEALSLFNAIKKEHQDTLQKVQAAGNNDTLLNDFFTEVEWLLHDKPVKSYDYYYDQIVPIGELLSTAIVSAAMNSAGIANQWLDVRDIMRTDNNFRDARIDWEQTAARVEAQVKPLLATHRIVVTQGFIGATDENESTTLGREGSDYTAAVFANLLDASDQTIWKDVQGVMNADPKQYARAEWIRELNYREVIEMAYYGAQVIHPKTIKPLQNKSIPLWVRSFVDPSSEGTLIHNRHITSLPPIIVHKHAQVLVELSARDYSFVSEGPIRELYRIFDKLKVKPNLTQNAAISLLCVLDDHSEKIDALAGTAAQNFEVQLTRGLKLLTIRHYTEALLEELCTDCDIILRQQTPETVQVLLRAR